MTAQNFSSGRFGQKEPVLGESPCFGQACWAQPAVPRTPWNSHAVRMRWVSIFYRWVPCSHSGFPPGTGGFPPGPVGFHFIRHGHYHIALNPSWPLFTDLWSTSMHSPTPGYHLPHAIVASGITDVLQDANRDNFSDWISPFQCRHEHRFHRGCVATYLYSTSMTTPTSRRNLGDIGRPLCRALLNQNILEHAEELAVATFCF
jgi:hypothetical protein